MKHKICILFFIQLIGVLGYIFLKNSYKIFDVAINSTSTLLLETNENDEQIQPSFNPRKFFCASHIELQKKENVLYSRSYKN